MKPYILAVDAGTSSFRTALYDFNGRMVDKSLSRYAYDLETDLKGRATLSSETILKAFAHVLEKTLESVQSDSEVVIKAAGLSFFWHSLVGLDSKNRPLTPVITWADGRCREAAEGLRKKWSEEEYHATTGCMLRSAFWPAKLAWLKKEKPQLFKKVAQWVSPSELILEKMTGKRVLSHSMAAGTGFYEQRKSQWSTLWAKRFGIKSETLPEISNQGYSTLSAIAQKYPQLKETLWFAGIGDGAASNLGLGATNENVVAINFGTSAAIRILTSMPKKGIPEGLFCYRLDSRRVLVGGAITNAGIIRSWFDRVYGLPATENQRSFKKSGVILRSLPFLAPERAPTWCEELPSIALGFQLETTKEDHYNSMMEASFLRLNRIRYSLEKWSKKNLRYRLGGGLAGIGELVQKFADLFEAPVAIVEESEASIRGAAIYVLEQLGETPPSPQEIKSYRPNLKRSAHYQRETQVQEIMEEEYLQFYKRCQKRGVTLNQTEKEI